MQAFLIILGIVWGILCLVLFFKIWGACNNIAEIKKHIRNNPTNATKISNLDTSPTPPTSEENQVEETTEEPDDLSLGAKIGMGLAVLVFIILIVATFI